jgi:hypothetical protein
MSTAVIRFPARRAACVWIVRDGDGAWLVLSLDHGWLHGDYRSAFSDACWLAENLDLPIRSFVLR